MTTSAVYPIGIAPALGHLHGSRNDIEIFVEDSSAKNVWRELLKNLLPDGVQFEDPIQLGSRDTVLKECRRDQVADGRKKLYIIDADLDLLKGVPKPNLRHLYRLRSYCLENYLLNEAALVDVATILDVDVSPAEARARLGFSEWVEKNSDLLTRLFVCYATSHQLAEQHQTIGFSVVRLAQCHPSNDELCPSKTSVRIFGLNRLVCRDVGSNQLREVGSVVQSNSSRLGPLRFVSGKDYLLPLMRARLQKLFRNQLPDSTLKVLLARATTKDIDPYLGRRLRFICA
jgi:hypothetical protein